LIISPFICQSIIIDTGESIPPSLPSPKGGIPLFEKEGLGEILKAYVWSIMDSLVIWTAMKKPLKIC
jgi:hypothetical protein